jgi:hypothetical protein
MDLAYLEKNNIKCAKCNNEKCKQLKLLTKTITCYHDNAFSNVAYNKFDIYGDIEYIILYRFCPIEQEDINLLVHSMRVLKYYNKQGEIINNDNLYQLFC